MAEMAAMEDDPADEQDGLESIENLENTKGKLVKGVLVKLLLCKSNKPKLGFRNI
jgi:hypothetical protein